MKAGFHCNCTSLVTKQLGMGHIVKHTGHGGYMLIILDVSGSSSVTNPQQLQGIDGSEGSSNSPPPSKKQRKGM